MPWWVWLPVPRSSPGRAGAQRAEHPLPGRGAKPPLFHTFFHLPLVFICAAPEGPFLSVILKPNHPQSSHEGTAVKEQNDINSKQQNQRSFQKPENSWEVDSSLFGPRERCSPSRLNCNARSCPQTANCSSGKKAPHCSNNFDLKCQVWAQIPLLDSFSQSRRGRNWKSEQQILELYATITAPVHVLVSPLW